MDQAGKGSPAAILAVVSSTREADHSFSLFSAVFGRSRLVLLRLLESIARNVELQDDAVVHEPVDRRGRRHGVFEDFLPFRERQIAREDDAASLVALGQQGEQNLHLLAILLHVTDVVEDQWTEFRVLPARMRDLAVSPM